jgi:succinate dehydrogenase / fumarate reductase membrane anchor subunit
MVCFDHGRRSDRWVLDGRTVSLRSPLGRVLGLGSAKGGTGHFWAQRVSGVALVVLGLWLAGSLSSLSLHDHAVVIAFIAAPLNTVLLLLLCLTAAYHSYLGVQVVIEDYVHAAGLKIVSLVVSRFVHIVVVAIAIYAILRIGLGA